MNRDAFVRAIVIGVRASMDTRYPANSEALRGIRDLAENVADQTEGLDDFSQQVMAAMCAKLGHVPQGERLVTFRDQARLLSEVMSAPPPRPRGAPPPVLDSEHEQFKRDIAKQILIKVRAGMNPDHRLTKDKAQALLRDAEEMAEEFIEQELNPDTIEVVIGLCGQQANVVKGNQLSNFIAQGKLVSEVLSAPRKTK
jgi:hypothetical protein